MVVFGAGGVAVACGEAPAVPDNDTDAPPLDVGGGSDGEGCPASDQTTLVCGSEDGARVGKSVASVPRFFLDTQRAVVFGTGDRFYAQGGSPGVAPFSLRGVPSGKLKHVGVSLPLSRNVAAGGDVNDDGWEDVVFGADDERDASGTFAGAVYVVTGGVEAGRSLSASDLASGEGGTRIEGLRDEQIGFSLAAIGDFNGDGIDDLLAGAPAGDGSEPGAGRAYVLLGSDENWPPSIGTAVDRGLAIVLLGVRSQDGFGVAVGSAGDVNGDGFNDAVVVGESAQVWNGRRPRAYVFFGSDGTGTREAAMVEAGQGGIIVEGSPELMPECEPVWPGLPGDVNGDEYSDVVLATTGCAASGTSVGVVHVVFGTSDPEHVDLRTMPDEGLGASALGTRDMFDFGWATDASRDLDQDGLADLVVGAPGDREHSGSVWMIPGASLAGEVGVEEAGTLLVRGARPGFQMGASLGHGEDDGGAAVVLVGEPGHESGGAERGRVIAIPSL